MRWIGSRESSSGDDITEEPTLVTRVARGAPAPAEDGTVRGEAATAAAAAAAIASAEEEEGVMERGGEDDVEACPGVPCAAAAVVFGRPGVPPLLDGRIPRDSQPGDTCHFREDICIFGGLGLDVPHAHTRPGAKLITHKKHKLSRQSTPKKRSSESKHEITAVFRRTILTFNLRVQRATFSPLPATGWIPAKPEPADFAAAWLACPATGKLTTTSHPFDQVWFSDVIHGTNPPFSDSIDSSL